MAKCYCLSKHTGNNAVFWVSISFEYINYGRHSSKTWFFTDRMHRKVQRIVLWRYVCQFLLFCFGSGIELPCSICVRKLRDVHRNDTWKQSPTFCRLFCQLAVCGTKMTQRGRHFALSAWLHLTLSDADSLWCNWHSDPAGQIQELTWLFQRATKQKWIGEMTNALQKYKKSINEDKTTVWTVPTRCCSLSKPLHAVEPSWQKMLQLIISPLPSSLWLWMSVIALLFDVGGITIMVISGRPDVTHPNLWARESIWDHNYAKQLPHAHTSAM